MKDIFANLYNKVVSFFHQTDTETANAKDVACNRLKLVLMQDRTNLTPAIMDRMRKELIELLSKYVELDKELLDLNFEHEDNQMALMLSIPVIRAKNEEEIQEILDREDEERKKLEEMNSESEDNSDNNSETETTENSVEDNECGENAEKSDTSENDNKETDEISDEEPDEKTNDTDDDNIEASGNINSSKTTEQQETIEDNTSKPLKKKTTKK